MPAHFEPTTALEHQLLLQLGDRLKVARRGRRISSADLAQRAGISRTTLHAVESGSGSPTMGTYLRVLSELGMAGDLALVASGAAHNGVPAVSPAHHQIQDLQSWLLHDAAITLIRQDPAALQRAQATLDKWRSKGPSHSDPLWEAWARILAKSDWRRALDNTQRGRQLRQASPLATILPPEVRSAVLEQVRAIKRSQTAQPQAAKFHAAA